MVTPRAAILQGLLAFVVPLAGPAVAGDAPVVERVEPPSWWPSDREQRVTLLVEGPGVGRGSPRVEAGGQGVRVLGVEPGNDGRYLFVDLAVAADAELGPRTIRVETDEGRAAYDWPMVAPSGDRIGPLALGDVVYLVMPDRFANGDPSNDRPPGPDPLLDRGNVQAYHGGDLAGLKGRLPYLRDLGVTALWLTPLVKGSDRWFVNSRIPQVPPMAGFHGYSPTDLYAVDPHLGTWPEYVEFVAEAHRHGLKVIQDHILGYVGPHHRWVDAPPLDDWFHGPVDDPPVCTFRFDLGADPYATVRDREGLTHGWFFGVIPDLNTGHPRVRQLMIQQSLWWAVLGGADDVRLDTYPLVERDFWREWSEALRAHRPEMRVVGEAWVGDAPTLSFYQGGRAGWDGIDPGVLTVFDFPLFESATRAFLLGQPMTDLSKTLGRDGLYPDPARLVTFLDNHDTRRFGDAEPPPDPRLVELAITFLMTTRGIPQLTWGDEIGLGGHMDDRRDFPGGFPDDPRDAFEPAGRAPAESRRFDHWRSLIAARKASAALRGGALENLAIGDDFYVYKKTAGAERMVVGLNRGDRAVGIGLDLREREDPIGSIERVLGEGELTPAEGAHRLTLPPLSAGVFRVMPPVAP